MGQKVEIDGIYYTLTGSGESAYATVVDNGTTAPGTYSGVVIIPNTVDYEEVTYKVTTIAGNAFKNCTELTSITIPSNISSIGTYAFNNCSSLEIVNYNAIECGDLASNAHVWDGCSHSCTLIIGNNVTTIPQYAFNNFSGLSSVTIGANLTTFKNYAFSNCTGITNIVYNATNFTDATYPSNRWAAPSNNCSITIGSGVTTLPKYVFKGLTNINTIVFNATEFTDFTSSNYSDVWPTLTNCSVVFGENVTKVPAYIFRAQSGISSVILSDDIVTIGSYAFYNCNNLSNIQLDNITTINEYAFRGCSGLSEIHIDNVESIGQCAFQSCTNLTSISLTSTISTSGLGNRAFDGCINVSVLNYNIPSHNNFSSSTNPFNGCTGGIILNIGNSVTSIPNYAFYGSNISKINIGNSVESIGDNAFANSSSSNLELTEINIPNSVTTIGGSAFKFCTNLTSIILGTGITSIGSYAFDNTSITSVISKNSTPPSASYNFLGSTATTTPIYVPIGSSNSYSKATYWKNFTNFKEYGAEFTSHNSIAGELISDGYAILLSGAGSITIKNTGRIICENILGATPENLIIEDGAQLICSNSVPATVKKTIANAGAKDAADHWYTIASPVHKGTNSPIVLSETNIISGTYDMFAFDEAAGYWRNQKEGDGADGFTTMNNAQGYLYRNNGTTISIPGNTTVGNQTVALTKTGESGISGLNLIGNPFPHNIYKGWKGAIDNTNLSDKFYYLTDNGSWQVGTYETPITPGMGIIVQANSAIDLTIQDIITSADAEHAPVAKDFAADNTELQFILNGNQYQDIAYAVLNEGYGLSKLEHPNEAAPMLFINHNDKNYAVAHMNSNTRSFNLGLSAKSFGQYTLKYKAKGNVKYLHVIDRLTGNDVDMLLEGEYSFIASPTDNENRFLVVLESLEALETLDGTFAYQNGNDIIVNGEGNLQIFDVMGRLIASQGVNGVETVNVSITGVYIFKLNEKTQKIVVR